MITELAHGGRDIARGNEADGTAWKTTSLVSLADPDFVERSPRPSTPETGNTLVQRPEPEALA
jgi:hypothetical protein